MGRRLLTLDDVPDELLSECGLQRGAARTAAYHCMDTTAELLPIAKMLGPPGRQLNRDALARILQGFRERATLPPVLAYHDAHRDVFDLIQGTHRWRCSLAYGFTRLPCLLVTLPEALEAGYKPR
jgi:hypothetical protein